MSVHWRFWTRCLLAMDPSGSVRRRRRLHQPEAKPGAVRPRRLRAVGEACWRSSNCRGACPIELGARAIRPTQTLKPLRWDGDADPQTSGGGSIPRPRTVREGTSRDGIRTGRLSSRAATGCVLATLDRRGRRKQARPYPHGHSVRSVRCRPELWQGV